MATEEPLYIDLRKMKMTELRKELQDRGLKTSGNKQELVDRLQQYMQDHEGAELADDDILKEELDVDETLTEDPKIEEVSLTSDKEQEKHIDATQASVSQDQKEAEDPENSVTDLHSPSVTDEERRQIRAKKFGLSVSDMNPEARKAARSERFGTGTIAGAQAPSADVLKKRVERFGNVSADVVSADDERRRKRLARFGNDSSAAVGDVDKKKKRAERFGLLA